MSVIATQTRREGNTLIFRTTPVVGVLALTGFTDDATSTDLSATFVKKFRYSSNGIIYSEWLPLDSENIAAVQLDIKGVFIAEISYELVQPTGADYLNVSEASFSTSNQVIDTSLEGYFNNSLFKKYFNSSDPDVLNWYINVLEKLYDKGLLANYIDRGNIDDFISFFGSVAKFFAFYVKLARVFGSFYNNRLLIEDFLSQRSLQIAPGDTLEDLQFLMETYYSQMGRRGTSTILDKKSEGATVNGELLRTIHYQDNDEFLFCFYQKKNFGWNLGNSSPLYRGLKVNSNLNKVPWSVGELSMENIGPYLIQAALVDGEVVMGSEGGSIEVGLSDAIVVDPNLDYQFSFKIKLAATKTVTFNLAGYDIDNNVVSNISRASGNVTNNFLLNAKLSRSDKYVEVRCYLYNKNRGQFVGDTTNLKQGRNIIANSNLAKIIFSVVTSGAANIKEFQIIPMMTSYSRGYLQVNNFISSWIKNRNNKKSLRELKDFISRNLLPYNTQLQLTNIGDTLYTDSEVEIDSTYWVGAGEYCRKVVWIGDDPSCEIQSTIWIPDEGTAICEQD